MPAGGDVHIERLDKVGYEFKGKPGGTYRLFEYGDVQVRCTLAAIPGASSDGPKTVMADVSIKVGEVQIAIPIDGQIRVFSKDFDFSIHALICTLDAHNPTKHKPGAALNAIPYINWDFLRHIGVQDGMSGLIIDGDDTPESEEKHRLHKENIPE